MQELIDQVEKILSENNQLFIDLQGFYCNDEGLDRRKYEFNFHYDVSLDKASIQAFVCKIVENQDLELLKILKGKGLDIVNSVILTLVMGYPPDKIYQYFNQNKLFEQAGCAELHLAAGAGKSDFFDNIESNDPRYYEKDKWGRTPLLVAMDAEKFDCVLALALKSPNGLAILNTLKNSAGDSISHIAAKHWNFKLQCIGLIKQGIFQIEEKNHSGHTPLHILFEQDSYYGIDAVFDAMLEKNIAPDFSVVEKVICKKELTLPNEFWVKLYCKITPDKPSRTTSITISPDEALELQSACIAEQIKRGHYHLAKNLIEKLSGETKPALISLIDPDRSWKIFGDNLPQWFLDYLTSKGFDIRQKDSNQQELIDYAIANDKVNLIKMLYDKIPAGELQSKFFDFFEGTNCTSEDFCSLIEFLCGKKFPLRYTHFSLLKYFDYALKLSKFPLALLVFENGCDVSEFENEVIELITSKADKFSPEFKVSLFLLALKNQKFRLVNFLLSQGVDIEAVDQEVQVNVLKALSNEIPDEIITILSKSVGFIKLLANAITQKKYLLARKIIDLNLELKYDNSNDDNEVKLCKFVNENPSLLKEHAENFFQILLNDNSSESFLRFLVGKGFQVNQRNLLGDTSLITALKERQYKLCKRLIVVCDANIFVTDAYEVPAYKLFPLLEEVKVGDFELTKIAAEKGVSLEVYRNDADENMLYVLPDDIKEEDLDYLLSHGLNFKANNKYSPLIPALLQGKFALSTLLIKKGIIINAESNSEVFFALPDNTPEQFFMLLLNMTQECNLINRSSVISGVKFTPLKLAMVTSKNKLAKLIIENTVQHIDTNFILNEPFPGTSIPMFVQLAINGNIELCSMLLENKLINLNDYSFIIQAVVCISSCPNRLEMLQFLIRSGAKILFDSHVASTVYSTSNNEITAVFLRSISQKKGKLLDAFSQKNWKEVDEILNDPDANYIVSWRENNGESLYLSLIQRLIKFERSSKEYQVAKKVVQKITSMLSSGCKSLLLEDLNSDGMNIKEYAAKIGRPDIEELFCCTSEIILTRMFKNPIPELNNQFVQAFIYMMAEPLDLDEEDDPFKATENAMDCVKFSCSSVSHPMTKDLLGFFNEAFIKVELVSNQNGKEKYEVSIKFSPALREYLKSCFNSITQLQADQHSDDIKKRVNEIMEGIEYVSNPQQYSVPLMKISPENMARVVIFPIVYGYASLCYEMAGNQNRFMESESNNKIKKREREPSQTTALELESEIKLKKNKPFQSSVSATLFYSPGSWESFYVALSKQLDNKEGFDFARLPANIKPHQYLANMISENKIQSAKPIEAACRFLKCLIEIVDTRTGKSTFHGITKQGEYVVTENLDNSQREQNILKIQFDGHQYLSFEPNHIVEKEKNMSPGQ